MKKVFKVLFAVSCILTTASHLNAQENAYAASFSNGNITNLNPGKSVNAPADVSTKVYNDVTKRFGNASDVHWSIARNHTFVSLNDNGVTVRAAYNNKGNMKYTARYYYGIQVPRKYLDMAKNNGYTMNIIQVTVVERPYVTSTFIKMEDKTSYVTILVNPNGDISVYEEFLKAS